MENWRSLSGFDGYYDVSDLGRIKSLKRQILRRDGSYQSRRESFIKPNTIGTGYSYVVLSKDGEGKSYLLHRLVAQTFQPNPHNKPQVSHLDGNLNNNRASNLIWSTQQEIVDRCIESGNFKTASSKKSQNTINEIKRLYLLGYSKSEIGRFVGATPQTVHKYLMGICL